MAEIILGIVCFVFSGLFLVVGLLAVWSGALKRSVTGEEESSPAVWLILIAITLALFGVYFL